MNNLIMLKNGMPSKEVHELYWLINDNTSDLNDDAWMLTASPHNEDLNLARIDVRVLFLIAERFGNKVLMESDKRNLSWWRPFEARSLSIDNSINVATFSSKDEIRNIHNYNVRYLYDVRFVLENSNSRYVFENWNFEFAPKARI